MSGDLLKWFIAEVDELELWSDKAVRKPLSKHQEMIKELLELVEELKLRYYESI